MPADFNACVADKGKVITKTLSGGRYMHLCKDRVGKWHQGEIKKKSAKSFIEPIMEK